jgi:hypothetical protein
VENKKAITIASQKQIKANREAIRAARNSTKKGKKNKVADTNSSVASEDPNAGTKKGKKKNVSEQGKKRKRVDTNSSVASTRKKGRKTLGQGNAAVLVEDETPWPRIDVNKAVKVFVEITKDPMNKTLIVGVDDAHNCAQLIVRIFGTYINSSIAIIESNVHQIKKLKDTLSNMMGELMSVLEGSKQLLFIELCVIETRFSHNFALDGCSHMYVLSSGECIKYMSMISCNPK